MLDILLWCFIIFTMIVLMAFTAAAFGLWIILIWDEAAIEIRGFMKKFSSRKKHGV